MCGSVSNASYRIWIAYCRHSSTSGSPASPERTTRSSCLTTRRCWTTRANSWRSSSSRRNPSRRARSPKSVSNRCRPRVDRGHSFGSAVSYRQAGQRLSARHPAVTFDPTMSASQRFPNFTTSLPVACDMSTSMVTSLGVQEASTAPSVPTGCREAGGKGLPPGRPRDGHTPQLAMRGCGSPRIAPARRCGRSGSSGSGRAWRAPRRRRRWHRTVRCRVGTARPR
jgi:hypothetical protein